MKNRIEVGDKVQVCFVSDGSLRFCSWKWDATEQRWMTGCGYGFTPSGDRDHTGTFLPFPFCPYCGARIRKPNAKGETQND